MLARSAERGCPAHGTKLALPMAPATPASPPQVIHKTQGNASHQRAVVVGFWGRVAPALWRLTFAALISWVVLSVGGSALAVRPVRTYTCRACDLAAVVLERPGQAAMRLEEIIALDEILARSLIRPTVSQN